MAEAVKENKMGTAPVGRLILSMSLPPVCSMFMQYSYNFVDSAFVAQLSEKALTAVSLSFPITSLMCACSIGLGVGINVVIARSLGRRDQDKANEIVTLGILMAFLFGVVLNGLAAAVSGPYFRSFTADEEIYRLAMEYMSVCVFMQVPNMVHIAIQKIVQATGNMLAPMGFQIAGVVFNLIFDPILIFGWGPFPAMGIRGAALSTVLGFTLSTVLAFWVLLCTPQKVKMKLRGFRVRLSEAREILTLGLPSFILNALNSFTVTFANLFLKPDMTAVAFFGAYFKAQHMIVMTVNGLIQGTLPVMSFNYGAGKPDRLLPLRSLGRGGADDPGRPHPLLLPERGAGALRRLAGTAGAGRPRHARPGAGLPLQRPLHPGGHLPPGGGPGPGQHGHQPHPAAGPSRAHDVAAGQALRHDGHLGGLPGDGGPDPGFGLCPPPALPGGAAPGRRVMLSKRRPAGGAFFRPGKVEPLCRALDFGAFIYVNC